MRRYLIPFLALALVGLAGCTDASITAADGSTVKGSMMNGQISYSAGTACAQVQPNPGTPIPSSPTGTPLTPLVTRRLCEGNGGPCRDFQVADPTTPTCMTQTATVRGTDLGTYFGWGLGAFAAAVVAFGGGL